MTRATSAQAFTLIELLVVIAIVALLMGILLPVLGSARRSAKATVCRSNQRQLLLATQAYLNDHNATYPQPEQDSHFLEKYGPAVGAKVAGSALWFNALDFYLVQQNRDYSRGDAEERNYDLFKQDPAWEDSRKPEAERTIKMNEHFGQPDAGVRWTRAFELKLPETIVLFGDGRASDTFIEGPPYELNSYSSVYGGFAMTPGLIGLRHGKGANIAFADGHANLVIQPYERRVLSQGRTFLAWFGEDDEQQELTWDFRKPPAP